jgi:hypothetical protein
MAYPQDQIRSWLVDLATARDDTASLSDRPTYDEGAQMTYPREHGFAPAIAADWRSPGSRKAGLDVGEDQRGF